MRLEARLTWASPLKKLASFGTQPTLDLRVLLQIMYFSCWDNDAVMTSMWSGVEERKALQGWHIIDNQQVTL